MILIEPDDNTNVVKPRCSTEDELENNASMVKFRWSGEEHGNNLEREGELEDECILTIPGGPMTCARSNKFKEAVSGMLRSVW